MTKGYNLCDTESNRVHIIYWPNFREFRNVEKKSSITFLWCNVGSISYCLVAQNAYTFLLFKEFVCKII